MIPPQGDTVIRVIGLVMLVAWSVAFVWIVLCYSYYHLVTAPIARRARKEAAEYDAQLRRMRSYLRADYREQVTVPDFVPEEWV